MRLTRVFVEAGGALRAGRQLELSPASSEHVARVLRLRAGAAITAFDGSGGEWQARITAIVRNRVSIECLEHHAVERESPLAMTLLQSLARGEKMDWVIQKATELGVSRIVPVSAERSVVQIDDERAASRLAHWRAIASSACEQCGRNRLPQIDAPHSIETAGQSGLPELRLVLAPGAGLSLTNTLGSTPAVALLIGPEGGLTDAELASATSLGFQAVSFGPRILRTETAAVAAIAALQVALGDLGS